MSDERYWDLMSRYLSGDISLEQAEELLLWLGDDTLRADLLREVQDCWHRTKDYPECLTIDTNAGWLRLQESIKPAVTKSQRQKSKRNILLALVLFLVILCFLLVAFFGDKST